MVSDGELLRRYVDDGSEAAFTAVVQRHINMVYRAALRRVGGNAHAADDVTQRVFTDLARKAGSLKGRSSVAGWLHTGTRFASAQAVRAERRRRVHEQEAQIMHELDSATSVSGAGLDPFLDEVLDLLNEKDRDAVLLHYFEGRPFAEVGGILSLSADAARMRVSRSLERLRSGLARRGIASSAAALAAALSTQFALAVPTPLAISVAGHALSHARQPGGSSVSTLARTFASFARRRLAVTVAATAIGLSVGVLIVARPPAPKSEGGKSADETGLDPAPPADAGSASLIPAPAVSPSGLPPSSDRRLLVIRRLLVKGSAPAVAGQGLRIRINAIYGPLFSVLRLPAPALAQFRALLLERHEAPAGAADAPQGAEYYAGILAARARAVDPQIESFLGAADYARYARYEKTVAPWIVIDELPGSGEAGPASD